MAEVIARYKGGDLIAAVALVECLCAKLQDARDEIERLKRATPGPATDGDRDVIESFSRAHGHFGGGLLLIRKLHAAGLDARQIAAVLAAVESMCPECWDAEAGCRCADDD